ncbi:MAG: glycoside hydrolase family 13 protein, partial [[Eubacterium] saphenum]|nr:glycoside hydrolase family 13 protein [[Eubacterium] saphenum]
FGGDLQGITEKLDYLASLGVTTLYLCPIFEASTNHRYDTACYERIDPLLGDEKDFRALCAEAKQRGIRVMLDGVFNHTGRKSVYFNADGFYPDLGAAQGEASPYYRWYSFHPFPTDYDAWWGIKNLPAVNELEKSYVDYIIEGDNSIIKRWLRAGASGWRLDVADELPDEFLDNLNRSVKKMGADKVIYGEVWEDASNKESYGVRRRYLIGGQLDSVMNYPFKEAILNYVKYADAKLFTDSILTIMEHYPKPAVDMLMNFISTHDTERALTRLGGEDVGWHDKDWQFEHHLSPSEYVYGISLLKCAMVLQFFLPGVPCIYYGDEAGMEGYRDPFNRCCYPWGHENIELIDFTRGLAKVRRETRAFEQGDLRFIEVDDNVCVFARCDKINRDAAIIYLNKSTQTRTFDIVNEHTDMFSDFTPAFDRFDKGIADGKITVAPFDYGVIYCKV